MSQIVVQRRHALRPAKARRLAEGIAERLRGEYGGSYAWEGDTLHFRRMGASGQVAVTSDAVEIRVDLGLLLIPLRSRIEREIHAFLDADFGPAGPAQPPSAAPRRRAASRSSRSHGASRSVRPK
jgi:putative polyhydroxyalkanoate system protein